jgi:hypothetical protein
MDPFEVLVNRVATEVDPIKLAKAIDALCLYLKQLDHSEMKTMAAEAGE